MTDDAEVHRHRKGWDGFLKLMTWTTTLVVVTLVLMALFLV